MTFSHFIDKTKTKKSFYRWLIVAYLLPIIGKFIIQRYKFSDKDLKEFCIKLSLYNPLLISIVGGVIIYIFILFAYGYDPSALLLNLLIIVFVLVPLSYLMLNHILKSNKYRRLYLSIVFGLFGAVYAYITEKNANVKKRVLWVFILSYLAYPWFFLVDILISLI